jgi:hypothetical protein
MRNQNSIILESLFYSLLWKILVFATLVLIHSTLSQAQEFESYDNYDSIVRNLSTNTITTDSNPLKSGFDTIRFHLGVGAVSSQIKAEFPGPLSRKNLQLDGFEARFGIDLFSQHWVAETAVRSYNPNQIEGGEVTLREFDMLLVYHTSPKKKVDFKFAGGMAARYLSFNNIQGEYVKPQVGEPAPSARRKKIYQEDSTTPSSVMSVGADFYLTKIFSLGAHVSYRNPLIEETSDKGSIDGAILFTGHL